MGTSSNTRAAADLSIGSDVAECRRPGPVALAAGASVSRLTVRPVQNSRVASDARARILAALREILARGGTGAVTLEAVAAAAAVSKGGLLYHFPSKSALYLGLLEDVRDRVTTDMAEATNTMGPARAYLQYSLPSDETEGGLFTSLIAAVRTGSDIDPRAAELLADIFRAWEEPMRAAVSDPVRAELIRLVGNGVYLSAIAGLPLPEPEMLARVFDRVLEEPMALDRVLDSPHQGPV
jgi:AcrR family transcriptional regulator